MSTHAYPIQDNPAPMRTRESCYSDLRQCLISYEHQQLKQAAQAPGPLDSPLLPRGVMERAFASHRSFWVRPGEVVELIDIEDEDWWQVRKRPDATVQQLREGYRPIAASDTGWVPAQHVRLLVRRASDSARVSSMSKNVTFSGWHEPVCTRLLAIAPPIMPAPTKPTVSGWLGEPTVRGIDVCYYTL